MIKKIKLVGGKKFNFKINLMKTQITSHLDGPEINWIY